MRPEEALPELLAIVTPSPIAPSEQAKAHLLPVLCEGKVGFSSLAYRTAILL